ncbi:DUF6264 family protein [Microbacterium sp. RURRCA19A]|uniref:DUF6264 family protein n=1 Tax=Microbacterium sp. RURRCA19A TaxID=1907391 RepID=UPI0009561601|nr:DUF6264 family protein [Microbacterium sp. RURRCA19A]SIS06775.1 hypothetical protein SAMN05880568_2505 [Microbacterium sp. RURRCA19A]
MSGDDARPRPQYGEYASPEEQRARIQRPEVTEALEAGVAPAPESVAEAAPVAPRARGPLADRVATLVLLVYGLISVISTITQLLDFPGYAERAAQILGVDATYTALSTGYVWGAVASVVYAIGYLLTAALTWRRLRRGRIAFWVPLVGFVATTLVAGVCITIALTADPAFLSALTGAFAN